MDIGEHHEPYQNVPQSKKMSQYELAQAVGVARQTINLIENVKNNQTLLWCSRGIRRISASGAL